MPKLPINMKKKINLIFRKPPFLLNSFAFYILGLLFYAEFLSLDFAATVYFQHVYSAA